MSLRRPVVSALLLVCALFVPKPAAAHGNLKTSEPAAGSTVSQLPRVLRLDFTEAPELAFTRVILVGPDRDTLRLSTLRFAPESHRAILADIPTAERAGTYTVIWQMAGADGHPMRGRFSFTVRSAGTTAHANDTTRVPGGEVAGHVSARGQDAPPAMHHSSPDAGESSFDASSPLYVFIRWTQFTGLLIVLGAMAFSIFVLGRLSRMARVRANAIASTRQRAARLALTATAVVGATALFRLWAQTVAMHGDRASDLALIAAMLTRTTWGWGWLAQIAGVLIAGVGFAQARRDQPKGWHIAMVGAGILAFTPALSGHAIASPSFVPLAVAADALHVIGAGGWLGSLLFVVIAGIREALRLEEPARGPAVAELVNAFSPTALAFAGITTVTGAVSAWLHLGTLAALWQSEYGQRLLLKLAILAVVTATGAYNWLRVRPGLGTARAAIRVRRSASVEILVGVLVLLATAILVATPTATDVAAMSGH